MKLTHQFAINKHGVGNPNNGFTLLELIISITTIAIIVGTAAPNLANLVNKQRISASSNLLSNTLSLARSHALSSRTIVIVCHAKDELMTQCSDTYKRNTHWTNGAIAYADINQNNKLDETDQILTTLQVPTQIAMVFNQNGRLRFFPSGGSRSAGFYICNRVNKDVRHLKILHTGRTRMTNKLADARRKICLAIDE